MTLFLFQFGSTAAPGGCAWDGTRDADFSNNGAVGSEDYTFLVNNWLTTSACSCMLPLVGGNGNGGEPAVSKRAVTDVEQAVDFSRDGRIDATDVEIFERRHGLPHTLSKRMRGN